MPTVMKASLSNWLTFCLAFVGSTIAILAAAVLLNLTGDCAPSVMDCGETSRRVSFVVLGVGVLWLAYLIVRFIRSPTTFR